MMIELQSMEDGCGHVDILSTEELECKICYCTYNLGSRRPKVLECCHRLCAKCLAKILDLGESPPNAVVCPFCRYVTRLPGDAVSTLPDDCNLVAALALQSRNQRNLHFHQEATTELLLSPRHLSSLMSSNPSATSPSSSSSSTTTYSSIRGSPNFVVITIMEPPPAPSSNQDLHRQARGSHAANRGYRSSSLDSMASITQRWTVWNCAALLCQTSARVLVWVLGLLYFSSLPMGVYLLIMQRTTLGVLLVSLVPASLIMIMVYGFCQCICHEFWDCIPP
ncbi:E3 ubiquitin-protein ligase RNF182 [Thunnus albacares]|uniref:E3 ubiquitin-protein ligase RNF182 n=1 Tax=Thunnus maccoyii TaxID=8240 RepID=UPI001C4BF133|nr:E3 ubiquitin-protein ligase RNF182 [Thunnus maccoyii]XP_044224501.1 E3 ubiquitin-protein ligase RNF182 [Thunnus albacares]|eukprot:superscaffoldBa00006211_g21268